MPRKYPTAKTTTKEGYREYQKLLMRDIHKKEKIVKKFVSSTLFQMENW